MTSNHIRHPLLVATTNKGKIKEIESFLRDLPFTIHSLADFEHTTQVAETGKTFEQNALLKAQGYAQQTGILTLADDSGLEVIALNGKPGVYSARYAKTDAARNQKLLRELEGIAMENRSAQFQCVIAICDPKKNITHTFTGIVEGFITTRIEGTNGFGYDPVFMYPPLQTTFAQMSKSQKNTISHRGQALKKAKVWLTNQIGHVHK